MTQVELWYFDGCPHWRLLDERLRAVLAGHPDMVVTHHRVGSEEEARQVGFTGSPSLRIDGRDPFPAPPADALACRTYRGPDGSLAGAPTVEQLRAALFGPQEAQNAR